jgi:hypothetical protein
MTQARTTEHTLRLLLEGKLKDTKITGIRMTYRQVSSDRIRLIMHLVDSKGNALAEYTGREWEIREFDTFTICDFERMFDFTIS